MKLSPVALLFFVNIIWMARCAPPTCYSRVLSLSKEIMDLVEKLQKYNRVKVCMDFLPPLYLDVHNSCIITKLRDYVYVLETLPTQFCRERPRIAYLKRQARILYIIINRICYRDLVFMSDDCEALDSGQSVPRYGEDRLELLQES
uniref:Cytokine like 1 n=1 Tax=Paramormyrops kingsleyae TaxID=1676925 RepID=A0A3B3RJV4_9TELE|nr:cytokine-like protein 1 [Paramormyrops kingsleyae]